MQASAGSGKTTLLVLRVLNLLLREKNWRRILCITFTKVAAQEMLFRINQKLKVWNNMSIQELTEDLRTTFNITPTKTIIKRASSLFEEYCKNHNSGIRIYTIHAFSQYILQNFAYEAKLQPYFKIIDENHTLYIANNIFHEIQSKLHHQTNDSNAIAPDIKFLLKTSSINQIKNLVHFMIFNANALKDSCCKNDYIDIVTKRINYDEKIHT